VLGYIAQRLLQTIPVLFVVSVTVFSLVHLIPGDPVQVMAGESQDPEVVAAMRHDLGLDRPIYEQYVTWLGNALRGDLGNSVRTRQPVTEMIIERAGPTLQLTVIALLLALAVSLPAGAIAATRRNSGVDVSATTVSLFGVSMPNFLIALLLIFIFAIKLGWLPTSGYVSILEEPVRGVKSLVLPAITVSMAMAAVITRTTRSSMLESLGQDYVRTARAKGLADRHVIVSHAMRNAMIPVITVVGLQIGNLIAGAVITEYIFSIPGIGRLIVDSIFARDYPVVQGVVLFTALGYILANLLADLLYAVLDPRIRLG
jgi:peptide/nickel transport system permease protein